MKYQIAICDDCEADTAYMTSMVYLWGASRKCQAEVQQFSSAESFCFAYAGKKDWDILLLDIEMGKMDGVTLAKKLRKENDTLQIIFVTGYSDYISEGYEVSALHYLMKPVKQEKLFSVLDRAAEKLQKNDKVLCLEVSGEIVRLPVYKIRYADVRSNYITIHAETDIIVKMPLGELEKQLDDRFFRVGRSAVVNLTCISRVTKSDICLEDGDSLPLPRGAYEKVNRAIINMR